ncbi:MULTISPECIES: bifunctional lysylphosphatidylglycerol flippase/synthetase MprF [unclassified Paracoccus (in: a-proteobacteria)]|uniref:bifunctional lysylphosphatidylglycerol flippase/synthetase MprF n=1 Tax=unclassified Paracoccus (in: a-proteobacteria) TaxID=2688777 RepID=UPI0012B2DB38|nr:MULTISPECIES: bifunctional lysylphosphatidylglycerol flippase/synthetase MprF [unclassified Paracoccus (in: a-proteobacteria)]UXU75920.1 bifunctional lysylphosphatidylglycerol flippase/synthetase MprF [Paracoccus sp. SMMA_5]UXU81829.1 bifunctional lysylphosphatidylglycerol flippase/synthetase MprF [Paracoccus sp. SMMA_5_TC]
MHDQAQDALPDSRDRQWPRLRAVLPYMLAAGLFALGLWALYRLLAPVNLADVAAQVRATPWTTLALAFLATLGGYLALAGYDWSALRHIGKPLPVPVVLTGGLMAYAFGNTIGLTAISGGAVRWRIYSGLGLDGYDVAAVSTFAAISFGIAATVVGLGALALHPGALAAVLPFAPATIRLAAIAIVLAIALPLVWAAVSGRSLTLGRFTLQAPSLSVLGGQILFSLGDIGFSSLTLYLLLPASGMDFLTFLAVFAAATMAGIVSHVPGGIGVFETVVIAAMPAGTPVDKVAAALLMFRLVYYLLPFVLALIVLALYEAWRAVGLSSPASGFGRILTAMDPALGAVAPLAPLVLAVMVFGSGLWMSFSALIPPMTEAAEIAENLFPLAFVEGSALLSSALGAALIVLAAGIVRRSHGAFWLSIAAMAGGMAVSLVQGPDWERAGALALAASILMPFRRAFQRRTTLTHAALGPGWIVLVATTIAAFGFLLFFAYKGTPYSYELWWQFATDERAPRALRAGLVASLIVGLAALWLLLRAPGYRLGLPQPAELAQAGNIIAATDHPDAGLALTGDKALIFSDDGRGFVMFGVAGRSWIAYGGPVGPADAAGEAAQAFTDAAWRAGARPVFYEVGAEHLPLMLELGMVLHKMGEEAVVDLADFSLNGPGRKRLRAAHARALRDGLTLDIVAPPHDPALILQLRSISDDWLQTRQTREKGFSVGRFDAAWLGRWPLALVRQNGRIVAFANVLITDSRAMASIDLMRHLTTAPPPTMEFLFTELMLRLKAQGYRAFSLGMAPLSGLVPERSRRLWDRFGALIYRHGGNFYNFQGLRAFKDKFQPDWRPRYLAAPSAAPPLLTLADVARLIGARTDDRNTRRA